MDSSSRKLSHDHCLCGMALELECPFLCPQNRTVRLDPLYVKFFMEHLARQLEISRHYDCAVEMHSCDMITWADGRPPCTARYSMTGSGPFFFSVRNELVVFLLFRTFAMDFWGLSQG